MSAVNGTAVVMSFPGKVLARQLGRRVRPRTMRTVKAHSTGDEEASAKNLLIEGDNLQALASLYEDDVPDDAVVVDVVDVCPACSHLAHDGPCDVRTTGVLVCGCTA